MLTRPPRRVDGPSLSRRAALAAGAALVSATAGCARFSDDEDDAPDDLASHAPAETAVLAHLDVAAVADGADADRTLEELGDADPRDVDAAVETLAARTGLDPMTASELLFLDDGTGDGGDGNDVSSDGNNDSDDSGGSNGSDDGSGSDDSDGDRSGTDAIVDGDWSEEEIVDSLESATDATYEAVEFEGESVLYEPSDPSDGTQYLGVLGDGRFVVGEESPVRATLEVAYGDADPVSEPVRDAYDDARGAQLTVASITAGSPVPPAYEALVDLDLSIFDEIEAVGRSYAVVEDGIALEVALHVADERDAEELETTLNGALPYLAALDEEFDEARDDVELGRDGTVVEVTYEGDAEVVFALLDEV